MGREERSCPRCGQVNIRYGGWTGHVRNPKSPHLCTVCGADLSTGERDVVGRARGAVMWSLIYLLHAAVGGAALLVGSGLLWPEIINQETIVRWAPMMLGALVGLGLADRSRRSGRLLARTREGRPGASKG